MFLAVYKAAPKVYLAVVCFPQSCERYFWPIFFFSFFKLFVFGLPWKGATVWVYLGPRFTCELASELSWEESLCPSAGAVSRGILFWADIKVLHSVVPTSVLDPHENLNGGVLDLLLIFYFLLLVGFSIVRRSSVNRKMIAAHISWPLSPHHP